MSRPDRVGCGEGAQGLQGVAVGPHGLGVALGREQKAGHAGLGRMSPFLLPDQVGRSCRLPTSVLDLLDGGHGVRGHPFGSGPERARSAAG